METIADKTVGATGHTPGPWRSQGVVVWHSVPAGVTIATCNDSSETFTGTHEHPISRSIGRAEAQANARLIAAAPDLLTMVELLVAWLYDPMNKLGLDTERDLVIPAEAIIAKARGSAVSA